MAYAEFDSVGQDLTECLVFVVESGLHSIDLQIKSLKRLTRALQDATPDGKEEVEAVAELVEEVGLYFGSAEAMRRYNIDTKFAGRRALEEARCVST